MRTKMLRKISVVMVSVMFFATMLSSCHKGGCPTFGKEAPATFEERC
jgi:hypothetical protein